MLNHVIYLFRNNLEEILKKKLNLLILSIFCTSSFGFNLYPVERAILNELITTNNLVQPISDYPITLETSFLLELISSTNSLVGDVNGDMIINVLDVIQLVNMVLGNQEPDYSTADVNQDGDINVLDVVSLVAIVLDSDSEYVQAGDMNQDGQIDVLDIVSLVQIILNI